MEEIQESLNELIGVLKDLSRYVEEQNDTIQRMYTILEEINDR